MIFIAIPRHLSCALTCGENMEIGLVCGAFSICFMRKVYHWGDIVDTAIYDHGPELVTTHHPRRDEIIGHVIVSPKPLNVMKAREGTSMFVLVAG